MSIKKRIVIYHGGCPDGFTAAWVAWCNWGDTDTEYHEAFHGNPPPDVTGREVWIVDFSYPRDVIERMAKDAESIRILDHHKSAQEKLGDLPYAFFDMSRSGAGIIWDTLGDPKRRPWIVNYVEDRDLWKFWLPESKAINAWIDIQEKTFDSWSHLYNEGRAEAAVKGDPVLVSIDAYVREMVKEARWISFEGFRIPAVNAPYVHISELVGKLAEEAPFAMGWSQIRDGKFIYSLRSRGPDAVNVFEIAQRYGGGGHPNAAGFQTLQPLPQLLHQD